MATTAQSTLVAAFKNTADAEAAANDLRRQGVNPNAIYLSSETGATSRSPSQTQSTTQQEGGFVGWLKRIFGAENESDRQIYENAYRTGNVLLAVDTPEENIDAVAEVLNRYSPLDIHREGAGTEVGGANVGQSPTIPVVEEELKVGKRSVVRGGVRVFSSLREEPVEEKVRLREETVRVDRQPVDRPATEADLRATREQAIEVNEYAEEPVVSKQARVSEEVRINKEARERTETVKDTVRHTEVNIENLAPEIEEEFRRNFSANYGSSGDAYDAYAPAYRYGYAMASDPRYGESDFSEVESDLRTDYGRRYPDNTWDKMKAAIRYGWDKVRGRTTSATAG